MPTLTERSLIVVIGLCRMLVMAASRMAIRGLGGMTAGHEQWSLLVYRRCECLLRSVCSDVNMYII